MAGIVVTVLKLTHFNFGYLTTSGTETQRITAAIDVARYKSAQLVVRLHENKIPNGGNGTILVRVKPTAPSDEDPRDFTSSTADGTVTIRDSGTDPAPKYFNAAISTINGPAYTVEIFATQGTTGQALAVQISVELVLRED